MKPLLLLSLTLCLALSAGDFPEVSNQEAFSTLQKGLKNHTGPYVERTINRAGNKTIAFESIMSVEADSKMFPAIMNDVREYPNWALKNINVKPAGGNYYVKIVELKPEPKDLSALHGFISIDLPLFKYQLRALFKVTPEETPEAYTVKASMVPDDKSILVSAHVIMKAFPAENRPGYKWLYVKANVVLRYWLLYEALPEKLLKRESGERIQIVLDNYADEEERRRKKH